MPFYLYYPPSHYLLFMTLAEGYERKSTDKKQTRSVLLLFPVLIMLFLTQGGTTV